MGVGKARPVAQDSLYRREIGTALRSVKGERRQKLPVALKPFRGENSDEHRLNTQREGVWL
jgi:hypothetical protein